MPHKRPYKRRRDSEVYKKVLQLRKEGYSYSEIRNETGVAKSTVNNWLKYSGLIDTPLHFRIRTKKYSENYKLGIEISSRVRFERKNAEIQRSISNHRQFFGEPLFNYGLAIFQAEGSKSTFCKFSNSDFKVINIFIVFLEKYFSLERRVNMRFDLYIHETRKNDLVRIKRFWSKKINIPTSMFHVYWKRNKIVGRRDNKDYVGQMLVSVSGEKLLGSKLLALSGIILKKHQRQCGVV